MTPESSHDPKPQRLQPYFRGRVPITGKYYGKEYEKTHAAAIALSDCGIDTYPRSNPDSVKIESNSGDVFNFLGGSKLVDPPYQVQLGFLRLMKETGNNPVNNFCYVAIQDGYLGRTAGIEVAYAMAINLRLIFSESPTVFSAELPKEIIFIIKNNYQNYPHVPIEEISEQLGDAIEQEINKPTMTNAQRQILMSSILHLIRDLRFKYGDEVED